MRQNDALGNSGGTGAVDNIELVITVQLDSGCGISLHGHPGVQVAKLRILKVKSDEAIRVDAMEKLRLLDIDAQADRIRAP